MTRDIEIILPPGGTPEQHLVLGIKVAHWLNSVADHSLTRQIRLTLDGGPHLTREEKIDLAWDLIPAGLVDDVLVEGRSWLDRDTDPQAGTDPIHQPEETPVPG